jgi:hypothetical protein
MAGGYLWAVYGLLLHLFPCGVSVQKFLFGNNILPTFGLTFCLGMTAAVLVWQSRNILLGLPQQEKQRLEKQVYRIRQQGQTHPLWKWICD